MVVEAIAAELPMLQDVCNACNKHIVQPVLATDGTQDNVMHVGNGDVPGIKMALDGNTKALYQTSICELLALTPNVLPVRSLEEIAAVDMGGGEETALDAVKRGEGEEEEEEEG